MDRKVLVAGSDLWLLNRIRNRFEAQDYRVTTATSITEALRRLFRHHPHLVIVDAGLSACDAQAGAEASDWDGWKLCRRVREIASIPVIMLVRSNGSDARVKALKFGADDVLEHPVDLEELVLQAVAILRRSNFGIRTLRQAQGGDSDFGFRTLRQAQGGVSDLTQDDSSGRRELRMTAGEGPRDRVREEPRERLQESVFVGGLWIDFRIRRVWIEDSMVDLTPREFQLLAYLVENAGRILPPEEIQEEVWGDAASGPWVVRQYISQVRKKIEEDPARPRYVLTHPGVGYQFAG